MWLLLLPLLLINVQLDAVEEELPVVFPDSDADNGEVKLPQLDDIDKSITEEATIWLNSFLGGPDNDLKPLRNIVDETTIWLNSFLGSANKDHKNQFKLNVTTTPSKFCTTAEGKEGKCVKPESCEKELSEATTLTPFIYRETTCSPVLPCCALSDVKVIPIRNRTLLTGCGWTNPGGNSLRNLDIEDTTGLSEYAEFPWMIALLKKSESESWSDNYFGGGSLIHPSVVLTAAHKVHNMRPDELKCRAGEWDTSTEDEIYLHQDRDVRKITTHSEFVWKLSHYNAALLFLDQPFRMKDVYHIGLACLGRHMPSPGTLCYGMGWGKSTDDNNTTNVLKKIELPMVDPDACQRKLRDAVLGSNFHLHHTQCCAGGEGNMDTCTNDGGSPLVCPVKSDNNIPKYAVFGMVAKGFGCFQNELPAVYTKVSSIVDWVDQRMREEKLDTKMYII